VIRAIIPPCTLVVRRIGIIPQIQWSVAQKHVGQMEHNVFLETRVTNVATVHMRMAVLRVVEIVFQQDRLVTTFPHATHVATLISTMKLWDRMFVLPMNGMMVMVVKTHSET
jgi:hypothetical protein